MIFFKTLVLAALTTLSSTSMQISSPVFENQKPIPSKYTCQGDNVSPPLSFSNIPPETKSLVLIVDDPDAPNGVFDHWLVWNIPSRTTKFEEGADLPYQGTGHGNVTHYYGPCPPRGKAHHYRFKLFALNQTLTIPSGSRRAELEQAMKGHIIAQAELVGTYRRQ